MKQLLTTILAVLIAMAAEAQMMDPVHFTSQLKTTGSDEAEIIFTATIDPGWHVYATDMGSDGPISATFNKVRMDGVETVGKLQPRGKLLKQYD